MPRKNQPSQVVLLGIQPLKIRTWLEVVKVSTRGFVLMGDDGSFRVLYRHTDTYPTGLGVELLEMLKGQASGNPSAVDIARLIESLGLEDYRTSVSRPEDAFPKVQAGVEWIYVVRPNTRPKLTSVQVFRTSNPDMIHGPDFVFSVWFSYVEHFPDDIGARMAEVERTAEVVLNCMAAYNGAIKSGA
jgi:hypothetical protein